jgi:predicted transcriptional regulator
MHGLKGQQALGELVTHLEPQRKWRDALAARSVLAGAGVGLLVVALGLYLIEQQASPRYLSATDQSPLYVWTVAAGLAASFITYILTEETWKPDLQVVARIVEALGSNGSMAKTQLCVKSGLNYTSFQRYLKWMEGRGLVMVRASDHDTFSVMLTEKGLESHDAYKAWLGKLTGP